MFIFSFPYYDVNHTRDGIFFALLEESCSVATTVSEASFMFRYDFSNYEWLNTGFPDNILKYIEEMWSSVLKDVKQNIYKGPEDSS